MAAWWQIWKSRESRASLGRKSNMAAKAAAISPWQKAVDAFIKSNATTRDIAALRRALQSYSVRDRQSAWYQAGRAMVGDRRTAIKCFLEGLKDDPAGRHAGIWNRIHKLMALPVNHPLGARL